MKVRSYQIAADLHSLSIRLKRSGIQIQEDGKSETDLNFAQTPFLPVFFFLLLSSCFFLPAFFFLCCEVISFPSSFSDPCPESDEIPLEPGQKTKAEEPSDFVFSDFSPDAHTCWRLYSSAPAASWKHEIV